LDLDADIQAVESDLQSCFSTITPLKEGLRLPGTWDMFEAGIRAILGQQISVTAAHNLATKLINTLGLRLGEKRLFSSPKAIVDSELDFLKTPNTRKQTLRNLALHYRDNDTPDEPQQWLSLKGIGPWTVGYAQLRGLSDPDIYLGGDLAFKKTTEKLTHQ
jgi:AraC family transcriptional regulator of adaptative response / DNA-3-methyladenine glycosylase II